MKRIKKIALLTTEELKQLKGKNNYNYVLSCTCNYYNGPAVSNNYNYDTSRCSCVCVY